MNHSKLWPLIHIMVVTLAAIFSGAVSSTFKGRASSNIHVDLLVWESLACILPLILLLIYWKTFKKSPLIYQRTVFPRFILWVLPWLFCLPIFTLFSIRYWPALSIISLVVGECVMGALWEETLFRGVLFRGCQQLRFTTYFLVSTLIFGVLHLANGFESMVYATVIGMAFTLARIAGTRLYLLVACHAVLNFSFHMFGHFDYRGEEPKFLIHPLSILMVTSGITVFVAGIYLLVPKHWLNKLAVRSDFDLHINSIQRTAKASAD